MDQMIGRMLDNRYEILERIGTGGMAIVYKAKCHRLNRLVAIKILKSDLAQNEEFRRRIKTQTVLPCAETVPMLLWALLASGQIQMRKVDGWETLSQPLVPMSLDLAA